MMKEEFEKRIGLVITSEEYEVIEAAYMGMPESVDKDKFVKIWLREGGIQDLFDKRLLRVSQMKEHLKNLEKMNSEQEEWIKKLEGDLSEYGRQVKALKEKLAAIGTAATEAVA
jgi:DNA-binding MarR family transcriptional regulator